MSFDRSRLIKRRGIEPESRRATVGARVSDHDKQDLETMVVMKTCEKAYQFG